MSEKFLTQTLPQIQTIQPYIPGKPVSELQRELGLSKISKLASNENPLGASPKVLAAIESALPEIARYPDGNAFELKQTLAEFLKVEPNQLVIGNGSNELLEFVGRVFAGAGDEIIYSQYGFAVYPITAQIVGAKGVEVPAKDFGHDLPAMAAAITEKTKIIYIANPNNPTGTCFDNQAWLEFMQQVPEQVLVVLDEAYSEYVELENYPNGLDYLAQFPNLILCRTLSKAYGLASLRVGFMVANVEIISYINRVRAAFNVSSFAQVAAIAAIKDQDFVREAVELNNQQKQVLYQAFTELDLEFIPSQGNFVCVKFGQNLGKTAAQINQELLQLGVIVRPVGNYGMHEHLRISIGSAAENAHFLAALRQVLDK